MKIVAVGSVKDEADIMAQTVTHLIGEGVDNIVVSDGGSRDDTRSVLQHQPNVQLHDQDGPFDQGAEITRLARLAAEDGADWVIPFDADEFWVDPLGGTVRSVLEALPPETIKVHCAIFKHADWDRKYVSQNPLGKVAFRPGPTMRVHWGNHDVDLGPGSEEHGLLEVRELQYRDFGHFVAKVEKARELFESWDVPPEHGHHMRELVALDAGGLAAEWGRLCAADTVVDPIPFKGMR